MLDNMYLGLADSSHLAGLEPVEGQVLNVFHYYVQARVAQQLQAMTGEKIAERLEFAAYVEMKLRYLNGTEMDLKSSFDWLMLQRRIALYGVRDGHMVEYEGQRYYLPLKSGFAK